MREGGPTAAPVAHPRAWTSARDRLTLPTLALGSFLGMADASVVSIALARIRTGLQIPSLAATQYVLSLYLIVLVATLPLAGRIADGIGRRRAFGLGFAIVALGSLGCALAPSFGLLLGGRAVVAAGGAFLSGQSLALITVHRPPSHRTRSVAILVVVQAAAGLVGPPLGGVLVALAGWRAVFWVSVPLAAGGVLATWTVLRPVPSLGARPSLGQVADASLLAAVLGALALAITGLAAPTLWGWPPLLWVALAGAVALARRGLRTQVGGAGPGLGRPLRVGLLVAGISTGTLMSQFAVLPFWLQRAHGFSPLASGLVFLPIAVGLGISSPWAGRRADRRSGPVRALVVGGAALMAVGLGALAVDALHFSLLLTLAALLVVGAGNGGFGTVISSQVMGLAPAGRIGEVGALLAAARNAGVIVGLAGSGAVYSLLARAHGPLGGAGASAGGAGILFAASAVLVLTAAGLAAGSVGGTLTAWTQRPSPA
ncbi:MAG TPA: MFS transporter [Verrucomicrobiae bacterium]|nr:MFS transporter [Verrucomicrobiae bacterium]